MAIILSSSVSTPFSSVMICWNTVATAVNMSFRDELFALGAWNDWLGTWCWLCLKGEKASISCTVAGQACATDKWGRLRLLLLLCVAAWYSRVEWYWGGVTGRQHRSHFSYGRSP
jgi:hypothetical protein